ncbi:uncharacterized protein AAEQ78_002928 [Lycaon pictus]
MEPFTKEHFDSLERVNAPNKERLPGSTEKEATEGLSRALPRSGRSARPRPTAGARVHSAAQTSGHVAPALERGEQSGPAHACQPAAALPAACIRGPGALPAVRGCGGAEAAAVARGPQGPRDLRGRPAVLLGRRWAQPSSGSLGSLGLWLRGPGKPVRRERETESASLRGPQRTRAQVRPREAARSNFRLARTSEEVRLEDRSDSGVPVRVTRRPGPRDDAACPAAAQDGISGSRDLVLGGGAGAPVCQTSCACLYMKSSMAPNPREKEREIY